MRRTPITRKTPLTASKLARVSPRPRPQPAATDVPQINRHRVKLRADFRCEVCGLDMFNKLGGQVHHRQPRGMGGSSNPERHSPANLLFLCPECHADIESHRAAGYDLGRLVRRGDDPLETPVLVHRYGWVYLLHDGTLEAVAGVTA